MEEMIEVDGDIMVDCPYCFYRDCFAHSYNIYEGAEIECSKCQKKYTLMLSQIKR